MKKTRRKRPLKMPVESLKKYDQRHGALYNLQNIIDAYSIDMSGVRGVRTYRLDTLFRLELAYEELSCGKSFRFLESEVREILERCGFMVKRQDDGGLGWVVYPIGCAS